MTYSVFYTPDFERQLKRLCRKYKSLPEDLSELIAELKIDPFSGTSLGNNCYKLRLAIKSKGKGKSGGARIITMVFVTEKEVYLVNIYDKSEQSSVADKELLKMVKRVKK